jgi:hypothetical protein
MGSFAPLCGAKLPKPLSFSSSLREGGRGMGKSSCPRVDEVVPPVLPGAKNADFKNSRPRKGGGLGWRCFLDTASD